MPMTALICRDYLTRDRLSDICMYGYVLHIIGRHTYIHTCIHTHRGLFN